MLNQKRCLLAITGAFEIGGGIATVNRLVIRAFAEAGYSLDIYCLVEKEAKLDARYLDVEHSTIRTFSGNKLQFTKAVWYAALKRKYSYIFCDLVNLASIFAPLSKFLGRKYIVWLHGIEVFAPLPTLEGKIGLTNAWKRLASSEYTKEKVVKQFPGLAVMACDLALDPIRYFEELPASPKEQENEVALSALDGVSRKLGSQVILHVGRMENGERYKGQDSLIKAFPDIYSKFPDTQLVLAGEGPDKERLLGIARSYSNNTQAHIFMPGYVDNSLLDSIYRSSYVFAMPSKGEGFGLVYLEAMSYARACIGGRVDATPYVIREGVTGLLVDDPTSPKQVASALDYLLEHPDRATQFGLAGYAQARSNYLFSHFNERFWGLIQDEKR